MIWFFPVVPVIEPAPDGSGGGILGIILMVSLFFNAIPCLLTALALWRTAKWRGILRPWMALIPVADLWVLGSLCDRYHKNVRGKAENMRRNLPLMGAGALGSFFLFGLLELWGAAGTRTGMLLGIAIWMGFLVMRFVALCRFYEGCAPRDPGLYIGLSIACPILIPLLIFKCRW